MKIASSPKIVHLARIQIERTPTYLYLRQIAPSHLVWFEQRPQTETELDTLISGVSFTEAMQKARQKWKQNAFRTVICGFRYTLPERDEHGCNALFYQMAASYSSMNGVYFDQELGHNCIVNFASQEALQILARCK